MATHPEWLPKLITALFVEELYYVLMHWVIKMAFLLFYLRFATKRFRTLVFCTIGLNCAFTIIQWLLYCLQCTPLDAFFHPELHPVVKCIDNSVLAFVPAALVRYPAVPLFSLHPQLTTSEHIHRHLHCRFTHSTPLGHPNLSPQTPHASQHHQSRRNRRRYFYSSPDRPSRVPKDDRLHLVPRKNNYHLLYRAGSSNHGRQRPITQSPLQQGDWRIKRRHRWKPHLVQYVETTIKAEIQHDLFDLPCH